MPVMFPGSLKVARPSLQPAFNTVGGASAEPLGLKGHTWSTQVMILSERHWDYASPNLLTED